jgi:kynurenine 3-monooxygenase
MSQKITLVGAGLSGSLLSILLAKRGFQVEVYERRPDRRKETVDAGRSINLAVSARGINALTEAGVIAEIEKIATQMPGRVLHILGKKAAFTPYSIHPNNALWSVSRPLLNEVLMTEAEKQGVVFHFNQRCEQIDLQDNILTFSDNTTTEKKKYTVQAERILACDGANSAVRQAMKAHTDFSCEEWEFHINYKELAIPAATDGTSLMSYREGLHIWPGDNGAFMMIALPNHDNSFTCTMFMPVEGEKSIAAIHQPAQISAFFDTYFPDAVPIMPTLLEDYAKNPPSPLNIVMCKPWIVADKLALVGDACHAIVPFYGQGVNASFEDCIELVKCIDELAPDWTAIFAHYQHNRKANSDAISEMAQENFEGMSKSGLPEYQLKKEIEQALEKRFAHYKSQYELVSFSLRPYTEAQKHGKMNKIVLSRIAESLPSVQKMGIEMAVKEKGFATLLEEIDWQSAERILQEVYYS